MPGVLKFFSRAASDPKAKQLTPQEDVDVYPVHMLDSTEGVRKYMMAWSMRFNDVLDTEKLHSSLSQLIEIGDWRKLGGRMKRRNNGDLEIHVPKAFSAEKPAVAFSHKDFSDMFIEDHPTASKLPKATDQPSIQPGPFDSKDLTVASDVPLTIDELIERGAPQLGLHVHSFKNATLVVVSWPHTMMDALGKQALLQAWSLVLAGRADQVPPMLGAHHDAIWEAGDPHYQPAEEQEELLLEKKRLKGTNLAKFMGRYAWDMTRNPVVESRAICLTREAFTKIKAEAQHEVAQWQQDGQEKPFVSDGDVLAAWCSRLISLSEPKPRPLTVLSALNARFRLQSLLNPNGVYVQNMVLAASLSVPAELSQGTVGEIAHAHRQCLQEQSTEAQVLSYIRAARKEREAGRELKPLYGEPDSIPIIYNNMTRAEIVKAADFSAAVLQQGEDSSTRRNPLGTMVHHHFHPLNLDVKKRNWFVVLGKDHAGNYWISADLLPRAWAQVEEQFKKL